MKCRSCGITPWTAVAPGSALIGAWWCCWILAGILGQVSLRLSMGAETVEAMIGASWVTFIAFLFDIPLAISAILVVRSIHDRHELKHLRPAGEMTQTPARDSGCNSRS